MRQIKLEARQALEKQDQLEKNNLNQAYIREDTGNMGCYGVIKDYGTVGEDQKTCVYFKNLEKHLIDHIIDSEVVLGRVACLTYEQILKALAQKEEFPL